MLCWKKTGAAAAFFVLFFVLFCFVFFICASFPSGTCGGNANLPGGELGGLAEALQRDEVLGITQLVEDQRVCLHPLTELEVERN